MSEENKMKIAIFSDNPNPGFTFRFVNHGLLGSIDFEENCRSSSSASSPLSCTNEIMDEHLFSDESPLVSASPPSGNSSGGSFTAAAAAQKDKCSAEFVRRCRAGAWSANYEHGFEHKRKNRQIPLPIDFAHYDDLPLFPLHIRHSIRASPSSQKSGKCAQEKGNFTLRIHMKSGKQLLHMLEEWTVAAERYAVRTADSARSQPLVDPTIVWRAFLYYFNADTYLSLVSQNVQAGELENLSAEARKRVTRQTMLPASMLARLRELDDEEVFDEQMCAKLGRVNDYTGIRLPSDARRINACYVAKKLADMADATCLDNDSTEAIDEALKRMFSQCAIDRVELFCPSDLLRDDMQPLIERAKEEHGSEFDASDRWWLGHDYEYVLAPRHPDMSYVLQQRVPHKKQLAKKPSESASFDYFKRFVGKLWASQSVGSEPHKVLWMLKSLDKFEMCVKSVGIQPRYINRLRQCEHRSTDAHEDGNKRRALSDGKCWTSHMHLVCMDTEDLAKLRRFEEKSKKLTIARRPPAILSFPKRNRRVRRRLSFGTVDPNTDSSSSFSSHSSSPQISSSSSLLPSLHDSDKDDDSVSSAKRRRIDTVNKTTFANTVGLAESIAHANNSATLHITFDAQPTYEVGQSFQTDRLTILPAVGIPVERNSGNDTSLADAWQL